MKKKFWVVNKLSDDTAEMLIYGYIGEYEEINDAEFIVELRALEEQYPNINMRINCGGGDVYKGLTIFNAIKNSKANTAGYVDGIAASMGAVLLIACKKRYMSKHARYMTHRVKGAAYGTSDDMRTYAANLEALEETLAEIFAKETGLSKDDAKKKYITNADRWLNANEAVAEKLVHGVYDADPVELPEAAKTPEQLYNAYHKLYNISSQKFDTEMKSVLKFLGLPENATEAELLTAVTELKNKKETAEAALNGIATAKAKALVDGAIAAKKLTEADRETYHTLALNNYTAVAAMIEKIPAAQKPGDIIKPGARQVPGGAVDDNVDTWEKLVAKGDAFVAQFKAENEVEYQRLLNVYRSTPVA